MQARRWLCEITLPEGRELVNLSQAAPTAPPPKALCDALTHIILEQPEVHIYGSVLGLDALRKEIAEQWSNDYDGCISYEQVGITSGCNQAFTAVISTLAGRGDAVLLVAPWYFNHKMWLEMEGIDTRILQVDDTLLPCVEKAAQLIDARVKAIVLVSPNNPCGVEYSPALIGRFYDLAKAHNIALIIDETYRDFRKSELPAHHIFKQENWANNFIHLYSFSKAFRLTGHRVGAIIASEERLCEVEKFLDVNTICPNQIAQHAALWGLKNLRAWLKTERTEILLRCNAIERSLKDGVKNWTLLGAGAYFAFFRHHFSLSSEAVVKSLLAKEGVLALPGTMFGPTRNQGGDGHAEATMRVAFANVKREILVETVTRLKKFKP